ncbi:kinase domain-containing protein [Favolaschia claudopus]|uniref:Kinase domain-containing protein n=1 Tax=Favolaschia claudopus TaxID=2862362 RepID=A0AAW0BI39_9AGAR
MSYTDEPPLLPHISSYSWRFPVTSRITTALNCTNCLRFTLTVVDFARASHFNDLPRPNEHDFWYTIFNSEENFWLWEKEDEHELWRQFDQGLTRTSPAQQPTQFTSDIDDFLAHELQDYSKRISGVGRLSHLKSGVRHQFLTWLFIVMERFVNDATAISVCETIVTWRRFFRRYPVVPQDAHCDCDASILKDWVDLMLQVYTVTDLALMPWGSSCNCLDLELGSRSRTALATKGAETYPALYRLLFKMFIPAWPSILWVLFRMLKEDEAEPLGTFLSLLRSKENRDLFVWDCKDQQLLCRSQQNFGMGPLLLDWYRYLSEVDPQTWGVISSLTRVERRRLSVRHEPSLRIFAFTLMVTNSLNVPQPVAEAFNVDIYSEHWVQFSDIASPNYVKQPQLLPHSMRSEQFWSSSHLKTWLKMAARDRCFDILQVSEYTTLKRVHLISFILNNYETLQPLFAFYPATRCISSHSLEWLTSPRYVRGNSSSTALFFRSDLRELLKILKVEFKEFQQHTHNIVAHTWAVDLSSHAVQCLVYLTAGLVNSLQNRNVYDTFLAHRGTDAQHLLDLLQDLLDLEVFSVIRPLLFKAMWRLSRASSLYPRCFTLTGLHRVGTQVAGGGYGDIWKGLVRGQSVCVKMLRIFQESDIAMAVKEFGAEAIIWRQLCHPNVLPFFGLYYIDQRLCLISPWMQNGNIIEFLRANSPDTQKRFSMILDIASGLKYLHDQKTIRGDLKGINILVTPSERACIADFGLSIIVNAMTLRLTTSTIANRGGTARYHAPELFGETGVKTFASDIYAFGCVAYEIMTGELPFRKLSNDMQIMFCVFKGEHPDRLPSCTGTPALDKFWGLLETCWDGDKEKRPSADGITKRLIQAPIRAATTPVESADWDDQFTAKFRRSINMKPLLPSLNELERMIFGEKVAKECNECFPDRDQVQYNRSTENNSSDIGLSENSSATPHPLSTTGGLKRSLDDISSSDSGDESDLSVRGIKRAKARQ